MTSSLRARLSRKPILLAPGICDPLTALLATEAGAEALYLSGASIAYTRLGRPDIGLVTMTEVADVIAQVADRVATPLIVDADNGHGNALNMQRTMRLFEGREPPRCRSRTRAIPSAAATYRRSG